jgi:hypothetical protein
LGYHRLLPRSRARRSWAKSGRYAEDVRRTGYLEHVNSSDDAVAHKAHLNGLVAGYLDCSQLRPQQKKNLWTDLETRNGEYWSREEVNSENAAMLFYSGLGGTFRRYHLKE